MSFQLGWPNNEDIVQVKERQLLSRMLYTNPVCLLSIGEDVTGYEEEEEAKSNVQTVSWLTPVDNNANFVMSLNQKRYTAKKLYNAYHHKGRKQPVTAVLSVPVKGMENVVLKIGSLSGNKVNKPALLEAETNLQFCTPGWRHKLHMKVDEVIVPSNSFNPTSDYAYAHQQKEIDDKSVESRVNDLQDELRQVREAVMMSKRRIDNIHNRLSQWDTVKYIGPVAIASCCAHVVFEVTQIDVLSGHWLFHCTIKEGFVRNKYWNRKNFDGFPPYLSFLGSQQFAHVESAS
eukprot:m.157972 g.157972  ORF g.157972 m.157972 type:complete len:289 (+) comp15124_c0_seq19:382-1248(+)